MTTGVAYGGGVYFALKSDTFHDLFTEYIPYGEEAVLYLEERAFQRQFPRSAKDSAEAMPSDERKVMIPGKAGVSWKESPESDVTKTGKHNSAISTNEAEKDVEPPAPKAMVVDKAKETAAKEKDVSKAKSSANDTPSVSTSVPELLKLEKVKDTELQKLVDIFNDLFTSIDQSGEAVKYDSTLKSLKESIGRVAAQVSTLKTDAAAAAEEEIKAAHTSFDQSAKELLRRIDEVRSEDAAQFREEFESVREQLSETYQNKLQTELSRVQEVAEQRLRNELVEQAIEMNRKLVNEIEDLVEKERNGRLSSIAQLSANVAELEKLTLGWNEVIDSNLKTQQLQVAIDAVKAAIENSEVPRPFVRELAAVKELSDSDPVVIAAIGTINPQAYQHGIPSSTQIIDRFRRVANEVRKASLLPENAGITSHAASVVLSKVMFRKEGSVSGDDVESVLSRTANLLEEGNFDEAAREVNSLTGWAKMLSKDWLADVRKVLEVRQALDVRINFFFPFTL